MGKKSLEKILPKIIQMLLHRLRLLLVSAPSITTVQCATVKIASNGSTVLDEKEVYEAIHFKW